MFYSWKEEMKKPKTLWRWWAKAIGEKASKCDQESDKVAIIRTFIFATYLITNAFIVYGVLRTHHFPTDTSKKVEVHYYPISEYQPPPRRGINKPFEFE